MSRKNYEIIIKLEDDMWKSLFAMSRAYDDVETQGCSFRLLILSMSYMLSVIAKIHKFERFLNRFSDTIYYFNENNCMCDNGFKEKCPSTSELFDFMKRYYNFCMSRENQLIKKYSELDEEYNIDKMTKSWWGPKLWNVIHTFGAFYCNSKEYDYFVSYKCFIMCLIHTLPCKVCRVHFLKHTTKESNNINKFSKNNVDLLFWSFNIHNGANAFLQKPTFKWNDAMDLYIPDDRRA